VLYFLLPDWWHRQEGKPDFYLIAIKAQSGKAEQLIKTGFIIIASNAVKKNIIIQDSGI
jgi:hypothetical protein